MMRYHGWFNLTSMKHYLWSSDALTTWNHWDSTQYLDIARNGYHYRSGFYMAANGAQQPAAWFPGYGLLIRALTAPMVAILGSHDVDRLEFRGRGAGDFLRQGEVRVLFRLAKILGAKQFRQADHLRPSLGRVTNARDRLRHVCRRIGPALHLDQGNLRHSDKRLGTISRNRRAQS